MYNIKGYWIQSTNCTGLILTYYHDYVTLLVKRIIARHTKVVTDKRGNKKDSAAVEIEIPVTNKK